MNKLHVKFILPLVIIIAIAFGSCKKESNSNNQQAYMSNAEIIGFDQRTCPCCGGYEITIDNQALPAGSSFYLVASFPSTYTIHSNPTYPILVKIDYSIDASVCSGGFVTITRIENR